MLPGRGLLSLLGAAGLFREKRRGLRENRRDREGRSSPGPRPAPRRHSRPNLHRRRTASLSSYFDDRGADPAYAFWPVIETATATRSKQFPNHHCAHGI